MTVETHVLLQWPMDLAVSGWSCALGQGLLTLTAQRRFVLQRWSLMIASNTEAQKRCVLSSVLLYYVHSDIITLRKQHYSFSV